MKRSHVTGLLLSCLLAILFILPTSINASINYSDLRPESRFIVLKAVLIVGPQEDSTEDAIESMNRLARFLNSKGVAVDRFYNQNTNWENIVKAARGAHFFVYSGHGTNMGPNKTVGGLVLNDMISSQQIRDDLELDKNAIVILKSVCNGAGSSAGDLCDIGIQEATNRVSDYAQPFLEAGARSYYANNFENGCLAFLINLFDEKTVEAAYLASIVNQSVVEVTKPYRFNTKKQISIASCNRGGTATLITYTNGVRSTRRVPNYKSYNIAYVGKRNYVFLKEVAKTN